MASRKFERRRTKERKDRQRAERLARAKAQPRRRPPMDLTFAPVLAGAGMSHAAGMAAMMLANEILSKAPIPLVVHNDRDVY